MENAGMQVTLTKDLEKFIARKVEIRFLTAGVGPEMLGAMPLASGTWNRKPTSWLTRSSFDQ
jgi:hypothetical protein